MPGSPPKARAAEDPPESEAHRMTNGTEIVLALAPDIRLPLVYVAAGEFIMGEDAAHDAEAWDNEVPRRAVFLDAYWIGKYPVTVAQYAAFVQASMTMADPAPTGAVAAGFSPNITPTSSPERRNHPVTNVSWREAVAFCDWASHITGQTVQLPSEAQWEKAARGPEGRLYPWGLDAPDRSRCNFGNHVSDTTPVGSYRPAGDSTYHCADMVGNAWEWCADWYDRNYYKQAPLRNPPGPAEGSARVLRGGAWWDEAWVMRCAFRSWLNPDFVDVAPGFRVAVS